MARENARRATASAGEDTRFEFARKHVIKTRALRKKVSTAQADLINWMWGYDMPDGGYTVPRKARTPEEREELKELEAATIDAETRLLLHENDGRKL